VDPLCADSIRNGLVRVLNDEALRATLIERGRKEASKFRWETTVRQTLASYREAVQSGHPSSHQVYRQRHHC